MAKQDDAAGGSAKLVRRVDEMSAQYLVSCCRTGREREL
jgi:hypothetical protein